MLAFDVPPGHALFGRTVPCTCTAAGAIAARKRQLFGAPRLAAMSLDTFQALTDAETVALRTARATLRGWQAGRAGSLVLYAPLTTATLTVGGQVLPVDGTGCGKTHLAVSLAQAALEWGAAVEFLTEPELLGALRASYGDGAATSEADVLARLNAAWLLVLDDLGTASVKDQSTDWYQDRIFGLIDARYRAGTPIIITTNLTRGEIGTRIGTRAWSRLNEVANVCKLDGPNRRAR